jgi:hypothetical protein
MKVKGGCVFLEQDPSLWHWRVSRVPTLKGLCGEGQCLWIPVLSLVCSHSLSDMGA